MDSLISCVLIVNDKQYADLMEKIDRWEDTIVTDIEAEYIINPSHNQGVFNYHSIQLTILVMQRRYHEAIKFLLTQLEYVAFRLANTSGIIVRDKDELEDLWGDCYYFCGGHLDFQKDVLTMEERYGLIFKSTNKFTVGDFLSLVYNHPRGYGVFNIDLNTTCKELFSSDAEINICNEASGEIHEVNITDGFPEQNFTIFALKNLLN